MADAVVPVMAALEDGHEVEHVEPGVREGREALTHWAELLGR